MNSFRLTVSSYKIYEKIVVVKKTKQDTFSFF